MLLNLDPNRKIVVTNLHQAFAGATQFANSNFTIFAKPLTRTLLSTINATTPDNAVERTRQQFLKAVVGWQGFEESPGVEIPYSDSVKAAIADQQALFSSLVVNAIMDESGKVEASQEEATKN